MGNEMGNSNTTGLQEGENTTLNDQGTSLQETARANEGTGENHGVSFAETKYYHEKEAWIDSDDPKGQRETHSYGHTSSDRREQEETEVHPPAESPRMEISSESGGMQPASLSSEREHHEKQTELALKENILLTGNNQLERYISTRKAEEEEVVNSILVSALTPCDPEPQNSVTPINTDHDAEKFHANKSVQDNFNSPNEFEDIPGSNISCINNENDYQLDTCTPDHLDGIFVSGINLDVKRKRDESVSKKIASAEDEMPSDENFEIVEEVVKGIIDTAIISAINDVEQVHDGELISKMTYKNIALESQTEANPMADTFNISKKSCEESDLMRKSLDGEEIAGDHNFCGFGEELTRKSEIDEIKASQTDFLTGNSCTNNVVEVLMNTSCDHTSNEDLEDRGAKVAGHANHTDLCSDIQNEASVKQFMETEVEATIFERLLVESSVTNDKNCEELQDCKLEIEEQAEKQVIEIKEKIESSIISQQKEEKETGEHFMSKILELKEEASLLQTSPFPFQLPDQQQKSATGPRDVQNKSVSIPRLKPESLGEFCVTTASAFPPTSMTEETLVLKVDLAVENPSQEVPLNVTEATEVTTEISSSVSVKHSNEVCRNVETHIFARNNGEKGSAGRLSTESNPDKPSIHMKMRKCPSFNFDLRIEARSEESEKTPLLYQDKAITKSSSGQTLLVSGQNPFLHAQNGEESFQYEAMPVEEKVITLERNDSEKSRTPFLGLMKEDQGAHFGVVPKKQDNLDAAKKTEKQFWNSATKEEGSTPPKVKEKHKHRSSLFANCFCCATVIN